VPPPSLLAAGVVADFASGAPLEEAPD